MERRDWWKFSDKMMEEDYFERFFWNICKNNARLLGSVVEEDWEHLVQQQTSETSTTLLWDRKTLSRRI